jgi:hypothetical protein
MRIRIRDLDRPLAAMPFLTDAKPTPVECQSVAGLVDMIGGHLLFGEQMLLAEEQERCYRAVADLRRLVGETAEILPVDALGHDDLLAMRAACRKYLDLADAWDKKSGRRFSMPSYRFYQMLGAFREVMGLHLWRLGDLHDLDVDGRLVAFFPGSKD